MDRMWLFLTLMLLMYSIPSNSQKDPWMFDMRGGGNHTSECVTAPFPFGPNGRALPGFEVACVNSSRGSWSILQTINGGAYLIDSISLQGQVRILNGPIYRQCYSANGTWSGTVLPGWLNLEGTPYTISKNNTILRATGCDDVVMIEGSWNLTNGCIVFCGISSNIDDGPCSGVGCCEAPLPVGLKSFDLQLIRIPKKKRDQVSICSYAFFESREEISFQTKYFTNQEYIGGENYVVVLDWAIANQTCSEALNEPNLDFACKNNSEYYDSPTGIGYFCSCSRGYRGNPYVIDGCKDINECHEPETNPCVEVGLCTNIQGSAICTCPTGMDGDGLKDGSGCTFDINGCPNPETNPCVEIGQCINNTGSVACICPTGYSGNGKKDGSGCKKTLPTNITLGVCLILVFLLSLSSFYFYWMFQKRKLIKLRSKYFIQNGGWILQQKLSSQGVDSASRIFTIEELQKATDNYNEDRILGRGGYGTVYKGILSDQRVVAIKRSKLVDDSQVEQFVNEITILSQVNHRNVVKLLGCCLETEVPLLVYEFISNGTLFEHIHSHGPLSWEDRLRISTETARAIAYLHFAAAFPIIHRDIKYSNILLDEKFTAKVSDFGASRSVPFDQTHVTTLVQGTLGYLDPEYFYRSQLTEKSDVYSFGVVSAELLTGKKPIAFDRSEDSCNLATYFVTLFDDERLVRLLDPHVLEEARLDETHLVASLAKRCLNVKGEDRPNMKEVVFELEGLRRLGKKNSSQENPEDNE